MVDPPAPVPVEAPPVGPLVPVGIVAVPPVMVGIAVDEGVRVGTAVELAGPAEVEVDSTALDGVTAEVGVAAEVGPEGVVVGAEGVLTGAEDAWVCGVECGSKERGSAYDFDPVLGLLNPP